MEKKPRDAHTVEALAVLRRDPVHSKAFWWMYDNFEVLEEMAQGGRIPWRELVKRAAKLTIEDGNGNVPSAATLKRTWPKVTAKKRREAELAAKKAASRKPVTKPGPPPVARPPQPQNWARPQPPTGSGSAVSRSIEEHPLMKEFRRKSGG